MKNRMAATAFFLIFLITALITLSCGIKHLPTRNYYMITSTPGSAKVKSPEGPHSLALQVAPFSMQRIYNRQNILYRYSPNQIQYYEVERWAVKPDIMFTDVARNHLESSGLVNRVGTNFLDSRPDFRLEGTVLAVEKLDAGDLFYAHLAMLFKMVRVSDGLQVWEYEFDERQQTFQKDMVYTVRALSSIFESQMNIVVDQLDLLFRSQTQSAGKAPRVPSSVGTGGQRTSPNDSTVKDAGFEVIPEKR